VELHFIIHQQSISGKTLKSQHVTIMVSAVNFIPSHRLNRRQFQFFMSITNAEYGDVLYHADS
jgi:hypothetical protein